MQHFRQPPRSAGAPLDTCPWARKTPGRPPGRRPSQENRCRAADSITAVAAAEQVPVDNDLSTRPIHRPLSRSGASVTSRCHNGAPLLGSPCFTTAVAAGRRVGVLRSPVGATLAELLRSVETVEAGIPLTAGLEQGAASRLFRRRCATRTTMPAIMRPSGTGTPCR